MIEPDARALGRKGPLGHAVVAGGHPGVIQAESIFVYSVGAAGVGVAASLTSRRLARGFALRFRLIHEIVHVLFGLVGLVRAERGGRGKKQAWAWKSWPGRRMVCARHGSGDGDSGLEDCQERR